MAKYTRKYPPYVEYNKMKNKYPCNLFLEIFPNFGGEKFDRVYVGNISIIINVLNHDNLGFKIIKMTYGEHFDSEIICKILNIDSATKTRLEAEAKSMIVNNKEVIFNGFGHSKLRNKTISNLSKKGFPRHTATLLVDSGLYCVRDIDNVKDGKELIGILSKNMEPETVGKVMEDTLVNMNKLGFNTIKFGYAGKKASKILSNKKDPEPSAEVDPNDVNKIDGYKYDGISETTFKVQCLKCDEFFRIRITGKVNDEGKLRIDHNYNTESGIFLCKNCSAPLSFDKIDRFIRNYL